MLDFLGAGDLLSPAKYLQTTIFSLLGARHTAVLGARLLGWPGPEGQDSARNR